MKILLTILDGVGIGELPDAKNYGDEGSNTLANCANVVENLSLPNLKKLGIGNIVSLKNVSAEKNPLGNFGKLAEVSGGKDSTTGHWEIAGVISEKDFPYYTKTGFPKLLLDSFLKETQCKGYLGNKAASGTEIIEELGEEHQRSGFPIVYTSADSVFQIAAHEETIPLERLYEICKLTRERICVGEHAVGRIIARPFTGTKGNYTRTANRRDFSLLPPKKTLLNCLQENSIRTIGIGKIGDLFSEQGLDEVLHTKSNLQGIEKTISESQKMQNGFIRRGEFIFSNLVDFDQLYGHRRNPQGFAKSLEEFDAQLPNILETLSNNDWFFLTGDHGNDPTYQHTDHTREYVPLLCFSKNGKRGINIGTRKSFADVGKTVGRLFGLNGTSLAIDGTSFHEMIL